MRWMDKQAVWRRCAIAVALGIGLIALAQPGRAQAPAETPQPLVFDQSKSVYNRELEPAEPPDGVDWEARVTAAAARAARRHHRHRASAT